MIYLVDCVVGWPAWSSCSKTCGDGLQGRMQIIMTSPSNGGAACPILLAQGQGCNDGDCPGNVTDRLNDGPGPGEFRQGKNEINKPS